MLRLSQALGNVTVVQKGEQDVISDGEQGEWPQASHRVSAGWYGHAGHQPQEDHLSLTAESLPVLFLGLLHGEVAAVGHAGPG